MSPDRSENRISEFEARNDDRGRVPSRVHPPLMLCPSVHHIEAKKVERFIEGLRPSIQQDVTMCQRPTTFDDAVVRAYYAE